MERWLFKKVNSVQKGELKSSNISKSFLGGRRIHMSFMFFCSVCVLVCVCVCVCVMGGSDSYGL